jgi:hypothetical protein
VRIPFFYQVLQRDSNPMALNPAPRLHLTGHQRRNADRLSASPSMSTPKLVPNEQNKPLA